ncbi:hypothetical protein ACTXT7_002573 [Hymenolepis weldensis]
MQKTTSTSLKFTSRSFGAANEFHYPLFLDDTIPQLCLASEYADSFYYISFWGTVQSTPTRTVVSQQAPMVTPSSNDPHIPLDPNERFRFVLSTNFEENIKARSIVMGVEMMPTFQYPYYSSVI